MGADALNCRPFAGGGDRVGSLVDLVLGDATWHFDVSEFGYPALCIRTDDKG